MTMAITEDIDTAKARSVQKPFNNYNVFYILERHRIIYARQRDRGGRLPSPSSNGDIHRMDGNKTGYEDLELPSLPPRYAHLKTVMPANWYVPGKNKNKKRKHKKTHGVISFKEIATIVSENWKAIDPATKIYTEVVAHIQKDRHDELKAIFEEAQNENANGPFVTMTKEHGNIQHQLQKTRSSVHQGSVEDRLAEQAQATSVHTSFDAATRLTQPNDYSFLPLCRPSHNTLLASEYDPSECQAMNHHQRYSNPYYCASTANQSQHSHTRRQSGPIEPLVLDEIFASHVDRSNIDTTRSVFDEVDVSDEEIMDAYHSTEH